MTRILDVLLDLTLFPACCRVTELGLEQIMTDHGEEAGVDGSGLAAPDLVHGGAHIVVNPPARSEEHTSELQSLMRTPDAVFCLKKNKNNTRLTTLAITALAQTPSTAHTTITTYTIT